MGQGPVIGGAPAHRIRLATGAGQGSSFAGGDEISANRGRLTHGNAPLHRLPPLPRNPNCRAGGKGEHETKTTVCLLWRTLKILFAAFALSVTGRPASAADPQPYEVEIAKSGNPELDRAIADSSLLVALREKAPVGPFALVGRARDDEKRFLTVLQGLGFYKGQVQVRIDGHG